jgi:prepilin-type processing-associated H-X9-DG protein
MKISLTDPFMTIRRDRAKPCKVVPQASEGGVACRGWELATAFTLTELLITLFVVGVLAALLIPAVSRSKGRAKEARCISNLKQIYIGFLLYHTDNDHFPGAIRWQSNTWTSAMFFGGRTGRDNSVPPAQVRPLFSYLGPGEVFQCPADIGIHATSRYREGFLLEPSLFEVWGVSYWYHAGDGEHEERFANSTDGLGGRKIEWVKRPSAYVLAAEPPAVEVGQRIVSPGVTSPMTVVYWHRARRPGTADGYPDDERGPRVSPFLFVDGHVKFYDCSNQYTRTPTFPGEVEFEQ